MEEQELPSTSAGNAADADTNNIGLRQRGPKTNPASALASGNIAQLNEPPRAAEAAAAAAVASDDGEQQPEEDSLYECNICLDTATDAVVSLCGHLFCWPCLHQWLLTRPNCKLCPVCKAAVDKDKVIPLYGRNSHRQEDPRNKVPPRPTGQRTEPEPATGFGDGFHFYPFGFWTSSLNLGEQRPAAGGNRIHAQNEDEQTLSLLFLFLAFLCIVWLLFA